MEFVVGVIGFIVVALASWYTDRAKKQDRRRRDYYDG